MSQTTGKPILEVDDLRTYFYTRDGVVRSVDGVSFSISEGETLAIVGESGCGKSTTARLILRLLDPTAGEIYFDGKEIHSMSREEIRAVRKDMQIVFQDPFASFNPRRTIGQSLDDPLRIHGAGDRAARRARASSRLRSCVRKRCAEMTITPSSVMRRLRLASAPTCWSAAQGPTR